jgi:phospholipid/cholesterol/gamma-HCH transport system substrate-binding protein
MKKYSVETTVGIFMFIGLLCVGYLTVKLGKMDLVGGNHYTVNARFSKVTGLKAGSFVQMAGVEIGKVEKITLDKEDFVAIVEMKIEKGVPVDEDAIASIKTAGLIGDKYVAIENGGSDILLEDGDLIVDTEAPLDIEELVGKYVFGDVTE